ncbi:MAG TPA: hypothetical protein VE444_00570 [Gaiellaceae bacterium]|nr:hypothetical protein [Gaiellaceae bacterium]
MSFQAVVRALLASMVAVLAFAVGAQAQPGANGEVPSQAEVDAAIASFKSGT